MSNPAVFVLADNKIGGQQVTIEDNLGEAIHIHIGAYRISVTIDEFCRMADSIMDAAMQLLEASGVFLPQIDWSAFDWNWFHKATEIENVSIQEMCIQDLLTTKTILKIKGFEGIQIITPLKHSRIVKALDGNEKELKEYAQINLWKKNNIQRLDDIKKVILDKGYPADGQYIIVNQNNQIYDGDHRAGCIYHLWGADKIIPVLKLEFRNEPTLKELKKKQRREICKYIFYIIRKLPRKLLGAFKRSLIKELKVKTRDCDKEIDYVSNLDSIIDIKKYFAEILTREGIEYYFLQGKIKGMNEHVLSDIGIIVKEECFNTLKNKLAKHIIPVAESPYNKMLFLYSLSKPLYYQIKEFHIVIFDKLCCKSVFADALLPIDRYVVAESWKNRAWNNELGFYETDTKIELLFVIVQNVLGNNMFDKADIDFIESNKKILDSNGFRELLQKEFFDYTDKLILYLLNDQYEECINNYISNMDY